MELGVEEKKMKGWASDAVKVYPFTPLRSGAPFLDISQNND